MNKKKFNWKKIYHDSAEVMAMSISEGTDIPSTIKDLYEKLKVKYTSENRKLPNIRTYSQAIRKKLDGGYHKKNIAGALYQFAGRYDKMTLNMLSENIKIFTDEVSNNTTWLFIRLKSGNNSLKNKNEHLYYLSRELKQRFSNEILFISFDTDTLVIMCSDSDAKKLITSYFENSKIRACSHKKSIKNHSKKNNRNENRIKFIITSENFSEAF